MEIKILKSCSGYNMSFKQNEIKTVKDEIGKDLIKAGYAEKVVKAKAKTVNKDAAAE